MDFPKPKPTITHDNAAFFNGCNERKLLIQKCADCGRLQHPPRPVCSSCHSLKQDHIEASGKGTVHSFFYGARTIHPAFPEGYNVALIDLEEGVRIVSTIVDAAEGELDFGMAVTLDWEKIDDDCTIPVFRKA